MSATHVDIDEPQIILMSDSTRPTSIDLSLELERELDAESLPNSPNPPRPQSLDTNVLASIVTQLRLSLAETTKERDALADKIAEAQTREEGMRETLEHVTEKCIRMENELEVAANQHKEDEETIAMLRTKVEESRRALMRLQTEKRMSVASNLSLDLSRPPPAHASLSGPPSSKRASFAPLTGSSAGRMGHRRISSVSDSGYLLSPPAHGEPTSWPPPSPRSQHISEDPEATPIAPPSHNRRVSLLFGRGAAPQFEPPQSQSDLEVEQLRQQLRTTQQHLDDAKRELVESQEAHEASELCVRALRTFISENNVGVPSAIKTKNGTPAPPTPSHAKQPSTASSRWGFRLWTSSEGETASGNTPTSTPTSTPTHTLPPDTGSAVSTPSQTAPPRKFGGFFSTRTSTSSSASTRPPYDPVHQEPMFNGSDTSSLADSTGPVSPINEQPRTSLGQLGEKEELPSEGKISIASLEHTPQIPAAVA
ncbi:hypothetical protein L226DRAFT_544892 [Lentinus tigrinus ALCF2SS1-7]|uniref:Uncharacterized protein n=1 Tax=Lentinus tigrinus ALCF2SS1-6 TaxID=1328759 RepID=A0A5C2SKN7_9APHY|nr:hypothetical protein L227DRAFT_495603 [Lentinus tigrinus ALCF2SS1-6]RPD76501.1 hypothetical protein L226DRAFT_544892 [Lentinus tigrinus ALCF2SS1-7]